MITETKNTFTDKNVLKDMYVKVLNNKTSGRFSYYRIAKESRPLHEVMEHGRMKCKDEGEYVELYYAKDIRSHFDIKTLKDIREFYGWTNSPNHFKFQQIIDGYWNLYLPLYHSPKIGEFPNIRNLLELLFEDNYNNEIIFDYLSLLYQQPTQKLPVIDISKCNKTLQGCFLDFMSHIFQRNMQQAYILPYKITMIDSWKTALVAFTYDAIEQKTSVLKRIEEYITQSRIKVQSYNGDYKKYEVPCHLHFFVTSIFSSHKQDHKTRHGWWVQEHKNKQPNSYGYSEIESAFYKAIEHELPHFVHFIANRKIVYQEKTSLYFDHNDIKGK